MNVVVVDNASHDDTLATIADLPVTTIPSDGERRVRRRLQRRLALDVVAVRTLPQPGRAHVRRGGSARSRDERRHDPRPRPSGLELVTPSGELDYSLRRFPRLRSTYARALFLQRLLPRASWVDEVIRDPRAYVEPHAVEWITGACLLVRRTALEEVGGFDERFFMYCEDKDLCTRLWRAGYSVEYEPSIVCEHEGGAGSEASRGARRSMLTRSRMLYAAAHSNRAAVLLESLGLALEAVVRLITGPGGLQGRRARIDELRVLVQGVRSSRRGRGHTPTTPAGGYPIG